MKVASVIGSCWSAKYASVTAERPNFEEMKASLEKAEILKTAPARSVAPTSTVELEKIRRLARPEMVRSILPSGHPDQRGSIIRTGARQTGRLYGVHHDSEYIGPGL